MVVVEDQWALGAFDYEVLKAPCSLKFLYCVMR